MSEQAVKRPPNPFLHSIGKRRPKPKAKKLLKVAWKSVAEQQTKAESQPSEADEKQSESSIKYVSIVCISDVHMQHDQLKMPNADILVISGDFCNEGTVEEGESVNTWVGNLLKDNLYKHVLLIAGNHEGYGELGDAQLLKKTMSNCIVLHDESVVKEGINFYGTPWCENLWDAHEKRREEETGKTRRNKGYCWDEDTLLSKFAKIPNDVQFLIVHSPPFGIVDLNGKGNKPLRMQLNRLEKLRVIQCGHAHSGYGYEFIERQSLLSDKIQEKSGAKDESKEENEYTSTLGDFEKLVKLKIKALREKIDSKCDIIDDFVLCINAANDEGGTERNPEPPCQPIYFELPIKQ